MRTRACTQSHVQENKKGKRSTDHGHSGGYLKQWASLASVRWKCIAIAVVILCILINLVATGTSVTNDEQDAILQRLLSQEYHDQDLLEIGGGFWNDVDPYTPLQARGKSARPQRGSSMLQRSAAPNSVVGDSGESPESLGTNSEGGLHRMQRSVAATPSMNANAPSAHNEVEPVVPSKALAAAPIQTLPDSALGGISQNVSDVTGMGQGQPFGDEGAVGQHYSEGKPVSADDDYVHDDQPGVPDLTRPQRKQLSYNVLGLDENFLQHLRSTLVTWLLWVLLALLIWTCCYPPEPHWLDLEDPKTIMTEDYFGCFRSLDICIITGLCPGLRWADTMNMARLLPIASGFCLFFIAAFLNHLLWLGTFTGGVFTFFLLLFFRHKLREKIGVAAWTPRTCCIDAAFVWCCCWCAISQEARAMRHQHFKDMLVTTEERRFPQNSMPLPQNAQPQVTLPSMGNVNPSMGNVNMAPNMGNASMAPHMAPNMGNASMAPHMAPNMGNASMAPPGMATVGVDTDGDGRADYYYTGVDVNRDGIPDAMQQAPPSYGMHPVSGQAPIAAPAFTPATRPAGPVITIR